jgi:hypothetical protein
MSNENENFADANQLDPMQDLRFADTRAVSTRTDAKSLIDTFRSSTATSPWTSLDRTKVADRLSALVDEPRLLQQAWLNLCGPASFLLTWNWRDPVAFIKYATTLFDTGQANIGNLTIAPGADLIAQDYPAMLQRMIDLSTAKCPDLQPPLVAEQADWMILGAIRNSTNVFWQGTWEGDPGQKLSGLTRPEEVTSWLQATGLYRQVSNEANWATPKGIPHATGLNLSPGTDIILLVNANLINAANGSPMNGNWLLSQFPNHYIVLLTQIVQNITTQDIQFVPWSWGAKLVSNRQSPVSQPPLPGATYDSSTDSKCLSVPMQAFADNYYGAIIATMPPQ